MVYITKLKQSKREGTRSIILGLLLGLFLILIFFFFRPTISKIALKIFSPVLGAFGSLVTNISSGFKFFEPQSNLIAENNALKKEISNLEAQDIGYGTVLAENAALRAAFSATSTNFVPVMPISFPPQTPYDTLILNKGSKDGIAIGDKAYLGDKIVVGQIENVSSSNSQIHLYSSGGMKTESVLERTGSIVSLEGQGGGAFKLELPKNFDISEGDLVILPGTPRVVLAQVISVKKDDSSAFLEAYLQLPLGINGLSILYIEVK